MPVSFLNEEQERRYGQYAGEPAPEQLARYFHLDDADRAFVAGRRGAHMRLGFAVQLGIQAAGLLAEYAGSEWRWNHPAEIRDRYGYCVFSEPFVQFRLNRWLYALCWTGSDRPSALFDRATAWLIAHKVLLPGVTTLERSIARVRARAAQRLWRQVLARHHGRADGAAGGAARDA